MLNSWVHTGYAQRIHFGTDAVDALPSIIKEIGARRVMLVTTEGRLDSDAGQRIVDLLGRSLVTTFNGVRSHVPTTAVQAAVEMARNDDIEALVSFGGGSCADLGKAVCFFIEQAEATPGTTYLDRPVVAHVAIPTAYSGAEVTPFFGMTDESTRRKTGAGGPTVAPVAAIYDPVLTLDTPQSVSAETGMNCLGHGVECAYSPNRTPEAEAVALACIEKVGKWLPEVIDDPGDLRPRIGMLEAASLGGRCLQNANMGAHHGLAQLVGGRTGIPHGLANAVLLSHVLRFNAEAIGDAYWRIGTALGDPDDGAGAVDRLRERIGLPGGLGECGVTEDDIDAIVRLSQGSVAVQSNPRSVGEDEARAILEAAY